MPWSKYSIKKHCCLHQGIWGIYGQVVARYLDYFCVSFQTQRTTELSPLYAKLHCDLSYTCYHLELMGLQLLNVPTNTQTTRPFPNTVQVIETHRPNENTCIDLCFQIPDGVSKLIIKYQTSYFRSQIAYLDDSSNVQQSQVETQRLHNIFRHVDI